jgi:hypothetical protein
MDFGEAYPSIAFNILNQTSFIMTYTDKYVNIFLEEVCFMAKLLKWPISVCHFEIIDSIKSYKKLYNTAKNEAFG